MISGFIIRYIYEKDVGVEHKITGNKVCYIVCAEVFLVLLHLAFGLKYYDRSISLIVFGAIISGIYETVTACIDWHTGYVYDCVNVIMTLNILGIVAVSKVSVEFVIWFVFYMILILICEKISAFGSGDTIVLLVLYWEFALVTKGWFGIYFMLMVLLLGALIFDVFRRITGRKGGEIPYTPFIILAEAINLLVLVC